MEKNNDNSVSMDLEVTNACKQISPTGKSLNKVRVRKKSDTVHIEMDENVPIYKYKIIETEKI